MHDDNPGKISTCNLRRVAKEIGDRHEDDELYVFPQAILSRCFDLLTWMGRADRHYIIYKFALDQDGETDEQVL